MCDVVVHSPLLPLLKGSHLSHNASHVHVRGRDVRRREEEIGLVVVVVDGDG